MRRAALLARGSLLAYALLVRGGAPARAYVRAETPDSFIPLYWVDPRKVLEVSRPSADVGVTDADLRAAAQQAASAWSFPQISCTAVALRLAAESTDSQVAGRDRRNRIIMRTGAWCRDPVALTHCHDPAIVALTTVFSIGHPGHADDGEILEADIEVNAADQYRWGVIPGGMVSGRDYAEIYDLPSVLTHEMGHFIGLDHNCLVPNAPLLLDDKGVPIPNCGNVPANEQSFILDATMYPFMSTADVKLRTLTADDARAPCEMYPVGSPPLYQWTGAGGCSLCPAFPSDDRASLLFLAAATLVPLLSHRGGRARRTRARRPVPSHP